MQIALKTTGTSKNLSLLASTPKALGLEGAAVRREEGAALPPGVRVRPEGEAEGREGAQPPADLYRRASAPHFF
jgi:hypothetical protein